MGLFQELGTFQAAFIFAFQTLFNGVAAVFVFFVISGFVMGVNADTDRGLSIAYYWRFIVRRFFRLMPMVVFSVTFALLLRYIFESEQYTFRQIFNFLTLRDFTVNGPLWSLQIELAVSAIYPLLLFFTARMGPMGAVILLLGSILQIALVTTHGFVPSFLPSFILGLLVPTLGKWMVERVARIFGSYIVLFAAFVLYSSSLLTWGLGLVSQSFYIAQMTIGSFYIVCWVLYGMPQGLGSFLNHGLAQTLGRLSYGLYALHFPIVSVVANHISGRSGLPALLQELLTLVIAVPIIVVMAYAARILIEEPFMNLGRRLTKTPSVGSEPAAG